jgi:hypothetical protein
MVVDPPGTIQQGIIEVKFERLPIRKATDMLCLKQLV